MQCFTIERQMKQKYKELKHCIAGNDEVWDTFPSALLVVPAKFHQNQPSHFLLDEVEDFCGQTYVYLDRIAEDKAAC